jgi:hypothetical protein
VKVRMDGGWWRVPPRRALSAPGLQDQQSSNRQLRLAARERSGREEGQGDGSGGFAREASREAAAAGLGSESVQGAPANGLRQRRGRPGKAARAQEVLRQQPTPVAIETPIVTANGLVLTRQNQADSRTTRAHTCEAERLVCACVCARSCVSMSVPVCLCVSVAVCLCLCQCMSCVCVTYVSAGAGNATPAARHLSRARAVKKHTKKPKKATEQTKQEPSGTPNVHGTQRVCSALQWRARAGRLRSRMTMELGAWTSLET